MPSRSHLFVVHQVHIVISATFTDCNCVVLVLGRKLTASHEVRGLIRRAHRADRAQRGRREASDVKAFASPLSDNRGDDPVLTSHRTTAVPVWISHSSPAGREHATSGTCDTPHTPPYSECSRGYRIHYLSQIQPRYLPAQHTSRRPALTLSAGSTPEAASVDHDPQEGKGRQT